MLAGAQAASALATEVLYLWMCDRRLCWCILVWLSFRRASKMFQLAGFVTMNHDHCMYTAFFPFSLRENPHYLTNDTSYFPEKFGYAWWSMYLWTVITFSDKVTPYSFLLSLACLLVLWEALRAFESGSVLWTWMLKADNRVAKSDGDVRGTWLQLICCHPS